VRNLEYKARLTEDAKAVVARARGLGADLWGDLRQTDTYFDVPRGRLKLRETPGRQGELIAYNRDEDAENRPSDYELAYTPQPEVLRNVLMRSLSVLAVVRKRRTLLLLDAARIHLDNVDGLGDFLEIEVSVGEDEAVAAQEMESLLRELGFDWTRCIRASYLDLTLEQASKPERPSY
jgi:predicted adenylyl cyclase CyaB